MPDPAAPIDPPPAHTPGPPTPARGTPELARATERGRFAALFSAGIALLLLLLGGYAGAVALGAASCPAHGSHLS